MTLKLQRPGGTHFLLLCSQGLRAAAMFRLLNPVTTRLKVHKSNVTPLLPLMMGRPVISPSYANITALASTVVARAAAVTDDIKGVGYAIFISDESIDLVCYLLSCESCGVL